jgi:hypothetical protein
MQNVNDVPVISSISSVPKDFYRDNTPNAARLVQSLRHTSYDSYTALADIIDNSIDAEAKHIKIRIEKENYESRIIISDDGFGMSEETLQEALRLGSDLNKDKRTSLGCFGLGLKVASWSMCKKLTVLTKEKDSNWIKAVLDIDSIIKEDKWITSWEDLNELDYKIINNKKYFFDIITTDPKCSGTIILLEKMDKFSISATTQTKDILSKKLSRVFWKKIYDDGLEIEVNDEKLKAYDPLEWDDFVVRKIATPRIPPEDGEISVKYKSNDGLEKKAIIKYRCMIFPFLDEKDENRNRRQDILKVGNRTCGIYVYRNGREICAGRDLGLFNKHTTHHNSRIAFYFNASELDDVMGINFNKSDLSDGNNIPQSIKDQLSLIAKPWFTKVYKVSQNHLKDTASDNVKEVFKETSEYINKKAASLRLPKILLPKEKREKGNGDSGGKSNGSRERKPNKIQIQSSPLGDVKFEVVKLSREGPIYTTDMENRILVIRWNSDHPLYEKICNKKTTMKFFNYTIHAMATTEMGYKLGSDASLTYYDNKAEPETVIETFKTDMCRHLRILLSDDLSNAVSEEDEIND